MKKDKPEMLVYIGRMRPKTRAHDHIIQTARNNCKKVLVLAGSAFEPRTIKNPLTYQETKEAILKQYPDVLVEPILDFPYNDTRWLSGVQRRIADIYNREFGDNKPRKIGLIGHKKDNSSYYLNMFPSYSKYSIDVESQTDSFNNIINATDVRNYFYNNSEYVYSGEIVQKIDRSVFDMMSEFMHSEAGQALKTGYHDNIKYIKSWEAAPYPPTFVTVDAVVVQSGHVLLIKRKDNPGKGLWALPGGFAETHLTLEQNLIKELREETNLKVAEKVIRGSIVNTKIFDKPDRSVRGRTITHAYHIDLGYYSDFPKIKAGDDAQKAEWVPIGEIRRDMMFDDHFHIIDYFAPIA